jgi:hypothetical protein
LPFRSDFLLSFRSNILLSFRSEPEESAVTTSVASHRQKRVILSEVEGPAVVLLSRLRQPALRFLPQKPSSRPKLLTVSS